ncbi:hypothetical protein [Streptomyces sp. NPDC058247]|uniref:hypothetical protein n=1 Tax=Streptomyces sp. NPDC058247 TaxID=3346401 RepID=UPI0036E7FB9D
MHTQTLAAQAAVISETLGRVGAGGAAIILGAVLYLGIKYGKLKPKKGLLAFLGLLFAAACAKAAGLWDLFTSLANIPADLLTGIPALGEVGPAVPPLLAIAVLALRKNKATETAAVAFWLYVASAGTGTGSIWWILRQVVDAVLAKFSG